MKKILLSLFGIITLGLINFSSAGSCTVSDYNSIVYSGSKTLSANSIVNIIDFGTTPLKTVCFKITSSDIGSSSYIKLGYYGNTTAIASDSQEFWGDQSNQIVCLYANKRYFNIQNPKSSEVNLTYEAFYLNDLLSQSVPCVDSSSCESDLTICQSDLSTCEGLYSRLESDFDLLSGNYNTCTSELSICMSDSGSSGSGDVQWSSLYINQVQHLGNKNIYIDIPLDYEFSYTNEGDNFELTVEGLNQDYEYIEGVINEQSYIPTSEDLSNVFSNFGAFGSLLVVCLFVILVFYMIKKIFN